MTNLITKNQMVEKLANLETFPTALQELGWYAFPPSLSRETYAGKAKSLLNPRLLAAGKVEHKGSDVEVYFLTLDTDRPQDAIVIAESHLKQLPQFAVIICPFEHTLLIMAPANPDKADSRIGSGVVMDKIYLDRRAPSNFESEVIKNLKDAVKNNFRKKLQTIVSTEKVTKKFYDQFKKELGDFQKLIENITLENERNWYASVMLNRLMFIYFLQKKEFLDGNRHYLSDKLKEIQSKYGNGKFHSFYRSFLLRLFHEGLGGKADLRDSQFSQDFGVIPYLNGGLFDLHEIEQKHKDENGVINIDIPDSAFERVFAFFNDFEWCLDTRPSRTENEINPDVLGYIFEKYINQKQMGAYYTKEDITEYISKNTIIPYLFDAVKSERPGAFEGGNSIWETLKILPDAYIYDAVKRGVIDNKGEIIPETCLPDFVRTGMTDPNARMFDKRYNLTVADYTHDTYGEMTLPTETWREYANRRARCLEIYQKLKNGEIKEINDLITYNLDICQFAQDAIENANKPELQLAFWQALNKVTVLDPTCGSGAFLFSALNIIEPLYELCLQKMTRFLSDTIDTPTRWDGSFNFANETDAQLALTDDGAPTDYALLFQNIQNEVNKHPSKRYFIHKTIIVNNLYGVDIMPEAIEICKLRLFLKLAGLVDPDTSKPNMGLEPLPDIDFNIRAGNTLVGYATIEDIDRLWHIAEMHEGTFAFDKDHTKLNEQVKIYKDVLSKFRNQQLGVEDGLVITKEQVIYTSNEVRKTLDEDLWKIYKTASLITDRYTQEMFLETHQPFHWFLEFPAVMADGGFDVIIGNPPYVEYSKVRNDYRILGYETESCGNLYAYVMERSINVLSKKSDFSLIIPISSFCTQRMLTLQNIMNEYSGSIWISNYSDGPGRLFSGADVLLTIVIARSRTSNNQSLIYSTGYLKWLSDCRDCLFFNLQYSKVINSIKPYVVSKISNDNYENSIVDRIIKENVQLGSYYADRSDFATFYRIGGGRYWKIFTNFSPEFILNGNQSTSSRENYIYFANKELRDIVITLLTSSFFYWYFTITTNCRDLNPSDLRELPFRFDIESVDINNKLLCLCDLLMSDYKNKSILKRKTSSLTGDIIYQEFYPRHSKPIIDEIDRVLAQHYGFTDEELDFIINYDIKYRMGLSGTSEEDN